MIMEDELPLLRQIRTYVVFSFSEKTFKIKKGTHFNYYVRPSTGRRNRQMPTTNAQKKPLQRASTS